MKKKYLFLLILIPLFIIPFNLYANPEEDISFSWAVICKNIDDEITALDPHLPVYDCEAGDKIKLFIQPGENTYIYVLLYDSDEILKNIFPDNFVFLNDDNKPGEKHFIPPANGWFVFDSDSGIEKFYLLASNVRLHELESLVNNYKRIVKKNNSSEEIEEAENDVVQKIESIFKEKNIYLKSAIELPVEIAGEWRIKDDDLIFQATDISGIPFYAKKIRIKH